MGVSRRPDAATRLLNRTRPESHPHARRLQSSRGLSAGGRHCPADRSRRLLALVPSAKPLPRKCAGQVLHQQPGATGSGDATIPGFPRWNRPSETARGFPDEPRPEPIDWPTLLLNFLDHEAFESIENHSPIPRPVCYTCPSHPLAVVPDGEDQPCLYTLVIENRTAPQGIGVDDLRWSWSGSWRQQDGLFWTDAQNDTATLQFEGIGIDVIGPTSHSGGQADVYIDGVRQEWLLDTFSSKPRANAEKLWASVDLGGADAPPAKHTLQIKLNGQKNQDSAGTQVGIMGVIVYTQRERNSRNIHWVFRDREAELTPKSIDSSPPADDFRVETSTRHVNRRLVWQVGPRMSFPRSAWQLWNQVGPHRKGSYQQSFGSEKMNKQIQAAMEASVKAESDSPTAD